MNLLKALAKVGSMTFVSRILGFVRDTLIARIFGAGMLSDAFIVAFKIPNLLRRISAEGAFSQAFVPILAEYKSQRSFDDTHHLINRVATWLGLILVVVTLLGMLAAPWIVTLIAPGFKVNPEKMQLTVELLRITFPYIFFISLVSMAGGVLNTYNKFGIPAFTPVWLNVSMIAAVLFFADHFAEPIKVLAWAVFIGGFLQLIFQIPFLKQIGLLPKLDFHLNDDGVWRILKLMGPAVLGVSVAQISLIINTVFASFLVTGSVSWLYYADRLMEFPTGVLGVALGTILLPSLSKAYASKEQGEYSQLLDWGLRLTFILAAPAAVALAVLATPLVAALFHYGKFTVVDVAMTQQALTAYSVGLLGLILVKILAPGFYARQNIKTPVKIGIFTLVITQVMNVLFIFVLHLQHVGLALAIGLGACINASLLYYHLRKADIYQPQPGWIIFLLKLAVGLSVMGVTLFYAMGDTNAWLHFSLIKRLLYVFGLVTLGGVSYFATLMLLGFRPRDYIRRVNR
ncbi:murein biosynthesis integral membrane protein MurJ [Methylotenera sp.]|uniref:murein biosynthesis integral membrane protein MurJ n=1 Tax=Methylotenera sp. TaxID=2051956 RepID=UPI00272EF8B0|nr:murein biosynthesis integral membrane protein MurJ [Methylotenera sp.]MDP2071130.1 murein biosynthesis integral membrane protein MurJ [Methylotenera sp.]MDP3007293.1 murein biosynthesis integral membrane protein MurJ [Methylotenera sp.]